MSAKKFLSGFAATTAALIAAIMLVQWVRQLLTEDTMTVTGSLSQQAIIAGLVADCIRGAILAYLYPRMINAGRSYAHAIWFGMLTSLLAATLWVVYQYGVRPALGIGFLLEETSVTLLQGISSGLALGWVYRSASK